MEKWKLNIYILKCKDGGNNLVINQSKTETDVLRFNDSIYNSRDDSF